MGTPSFAVEPLKRLLDSGYNVVGVVTATDKPAGRGREMKASEIKQFALKKSLPVLQPEKLRDEQFVNILKSFNADIFIVVAFRMLPEIVWNMPPLGTVNLHVSLLPDYRGAAPVNHAVINGETETGVTTFRISHEIDTGEILLQKKIEITDNETAGELLDRLMVTGSELLLETVQGLKTNSIKSKPQIERENLKLAPKLSREFCRIKWTDSVENIRNLIRGLSPYPCAWSEFNNGTETFQFKIYRASCEKKNISNLSGKIVSDGKSFLKIACRDGYLNIEELQLQGKKNMPVKSFLAGFRGVEKLKIII
ncbi:MAG: methionyl-tRNA formyltransferase [Prevotellaceae bacterium]|jgi:methionyl-tRNA formyltransferase|nr:methionyl-tRNA formyltransferase [Prevotellaceae bacterium]